MNTGKFVAAALALLLGACGDAATENGRQMEDGAILFMPQADPRIHQDGHEFKFAHWIIDDATGYVLTRQSTATLAGIEGWFDQWKLDGRKAGKPDIYFLTRDRRDRVPGTPPWATVMEVAYAKTDGYLPLEDALYPDELSFSRIAGMLNLYGPGGRAIMVLDNRVPNRPRFEQWARERMQLPYLPANFDPSPVDPKYARLYLPPVNSAAYDPATKTAVAGDGSRLHSDNQGWSTHLDRDGRHQRMHATFTDASGTEVQIVMLPLRGYRKGYGETRVVMAITDRRTPKTRMALTDAPEGKALADLVNVLVPIAGEHAGHLVVIDNRNDLRDYW